MFHTARPLRVVTLDDILFFEILVPNEKNEKLKVQTPQTQRRGVYDALKEAKCLIF